MQRLALGRADKCYHPSERYRRLGVLVVVLELRVDMKRAECNML